MQPHLEKLAADWLKLDKNETTRAEISALVAADNEPELEKLLGTRIQFGTAGLRSRMQAGFARMNDLTVMQASQGLAAYILAQKQLQPGDRKASVVIGHDHRHNSRRFARLAAAAMISTGIKVYFYHELVHTPMVPFGIKILKADAGIMITASHNPAQDNGYKVYWSNGCQIVPPHDTGITAAIERNLDPRCWDEDLVDSEHELVEKPLERMREAYLKAVGQMSAGIKGSQAVRFVYTPMHGVGLPFMTQVVKNMGLEDSMVVVQEQADPNPDFPTVKFPNPEEKGALDLAIATADAQGIKLVIASDPDADRFAVAQKLPSEWRIFTGNEMGILFAAHTLDAYRIKNPGVDKLNKLTMLCSTVSSQMLSTMAKVEGFRFEETLTGFKWLGSRALALTNEEGYDAVYAFEEAIGYMFSPVVYDKDGIAAASVFLTMLATHPDPYEKLQQLYQKYGYFQSANSYYISPDPAVTTRVFAGIRALGSSQGRQYPEAVGGRKITWWRDLTTGFDSATADGVPSLPVSKSSQMLTCELEGDVRLTVRGSGTEPKIKLYIECKADSEEAARRRAQEVSDALRDEWFLPEKNGLL
ncbi:hypothetical protein EDC01DRAFT_639179 [Geopyxis carbonaria]|nr:hypothetical protein EDC01DRAFT_639179 [Geopyxis carbonaria]